MRMKDIIRVKDEYYISANFSFLEEQARVLKSGEMFAIFNQDGHISPFGFENQGLYFQGTRFLSRLVFHIAGRHPLLLSSSVKEENELMVVDFTNPDFSGPNQEFNPKGRIHLLRSCFLKEPSYYEWICVSNYGLSDISLNFGLEFDADYRDIFESRGITRKHRGHLREPRFGKNSVELGYQGLDHKQRLTKVSFEPGPLSVKKNRADFLVRLGPNQHKDIFIRVDCQNEKRQKIVEGFDQAHEELKHSCRRLKHDLCSVDTSNEQFNHWLSRSTDDIFMMLTRADDIFYPYAGIPWFSTVFGRDGLISALETLWNYPRISHGVLLYLSRNQSRDFDERHDAEPGKILHEVRQGEMANLGEIPFGRYYGSVDSTPLFLILAGRYYQRTGDMGLIRRIWPSLVSALNWINTCGDLDGDGFVEYDRKAIGGLSQQGWKDSGDSIFHKDGGLADPPIALCEVQGYVHEAKNQMSRLAFAMRERELGRRLLQEADQLKKSFLEKFWVAHMDYPAIALDARKNPCEVFSSNAGQCLFSGIVSRTQASRIRDRLMEERFFTGWGIRTLAKGEMRFNPMSYHNGSVWPHDNALIAWGLDRFGYKEEVLRITKGLFDASMTMDLNRLPELFCGFSRRSSQGPTLYPVACNPQTWSSAAAFLLLQSCLGLQIDALENKIYFINPVLPDYLQEVRIRNLKVGSSRLDLLLEYHPRDVGVKVLARTGSVKVVTMK